MVLAAAGIMTRYPPRAVALGLALTLASLLGAMIGASPDAALASPSLVVTPVALTGAVAMMCWAMMKSERSQRADAIVDPLTGLLNRKALASRAVAAAYQASTADAPVSLLICDLDHFKHINDEHGHTVGDAVLRDAAYALRSQLRTFESAFRIGGEEFVVLLPEVESAPARVIAERIRCALEEARPAGITMTVSIGIATLRGEAVTLERLLRQADAALYASKRGGRNRVTVARAGAPDEVTLASELARGEGDPGSATPAVRSRDHSVLA
jgi:diguanylate cyclase (GGDEF)-like protein